MAKTFKNKLVILIIVALAGLIVVYLAKFDSTGKLIKPPPHTKISLRLLWYAQTQFAGYYVAKDLGYYEEEGLDVEIAPSIGAGDILAVIGGNYFQFGITQLSNMIRAADRDVPVKSIAQIVQESSLVLLARKSSNINSVKDFKGKTLSTWWGREEFMSKMLLQMHGMDQNDIKILDEKYWSSEPFAKGLADVVTGMMYNEYNQFVYKVGIPKDELRIFAYKDYGLNFPEDTLFTSAKMIEHYPDICRKFLRATLKGWRTALKDKGLAVNIVLKYANNTSYEEQMRQLNVMESIMIPSYMNVNDIGYINRDRIQDEIDALYKHKVITNHFSVEAFL